MLNRAVKTLPGQSVQRTNLKGKVSVVHQHIDRAERLLSRLHHLVDLIFLRDVRLKDYAAAAGVLNFLQDFVSSVFILVVIDDDRSAALRQANGGGRANAAARAGHKNDFPVQRATAQLASH